MRTKTYIITGIDVSDVGIAAAQAPAAGTPLTLTVGAAALSPVRFITLKSSANLSAINFTIIGTDRWGSTITEVVKGPNNATVQSLGAYAAVTSITPDGTSGSNVSSGWPVGGVTPWVLCGRGYGVDNVPSSRVSALTSSSGTGSVQITYSMFPRLFEPAITIDETKSITPGTPISAQGQGARFVMSSGAGTTCTVNFAMSGPTC